MLAGASGVRAAAYEDTIARHMVGEAMLAAQFVALRLKRNDFKLNRCFALASYLRMIFSENRYPLFRIMR
jgi:hypothetical protein